MKKSVSKKAISHLKDDIKGYNKERKYLKKEAAEDRELIRDIKGKKNMKKQGYNARLDESLGARTKGKKSQSLSSRRKESEGMEKAMGRKKYSAAKSMDKGSRKRK